MDDLKIVDMEPEATPEKYKINESLGFKPPFFLAAVGARGSGKSNLIMNLFRTQFFNGQFLRRNVILFTPSLKTDPKMADLPAANKFDHYREDIIQSVVSQQQGLIDRYGRDKVSHILFVFDDCITEKAFLRGSLIELLGYRGRHLKISCIFSVQKYSALARGIRLNCDICLFWAPYNGSELQHIVDEHSDKESKQRFLIMFKSATAQKYSFLFINYQTNNSENRYRRNFDTIIKCQPSMDNQ